MLQVIPAFEAIADLPSLMRQAHEQEHSFKIVSLSHRVILLGEKEWERIQSERNLLYCAGVRKFVREHMVLSEEEKAWMADYVGDEADVAQLMETLLAPAGSAG